MNWKDASSVCNQDGAHVAIILNEGDFHHVTGVKLQASNNTLENQDVWEVRMTLSMFSKMFISRPKN